MNKSEVRMNLDGLEEMQEKAKGYVAKVGILGGKASQVHKDSSLTMSQLGLIHQFGSVSKNIPPRDFLIMPIERNKQEIMKAMGSNTVKRHMENNDILRVFKTLGMQAERYIQEAFSTGGFGQWAQNKPSTIRAKGSDAPLIDTGELRKSISSDAVKKSEAQGAIAHIGD